MMDLLFADLTYELRGISFRIHSRLRGGHAENVYESAFAFALEHAGISFQRQPVYRIFYRDQQVGEYRPDFMLHDGQLLAELKATPKIEPLHKAQTISYLGVTGAELGVIFNFGGSSMQIERIPNFLEQRPTEQYAVPVPSIEGLLYPELTRRVLDSLGTVHRVLGAGFLHQVYRRAARIEFAQQQIGCTFIKELPVCYDGHVITTQPTRLLYVENKLLVATVAMDSIGSTQTERMRWAMNEVNSQLGLIVNFHGTHLEPRFVRVGASTTTD